MIPASSLIERAARRIDDIRLTNVTTPDLLDYLNAVSDDLCARRRILERVVIFKVYAEDMYAYPSDLVQVKWMRFNEDPVNDPDGYKDLAEMFEDEFREATYGQYPTENPSAYSVSQNYFHLYPRPTAAIDNGGKMGYWSIPDPVTSATAGFLQLPDYLQHHVIEGMVIRALEGQRRLDEAEQRRVRWLTVEDELAQPMQDRSADRRSSLRPPTHRDRFAGHV